MLVVTSGLTPGETVAMGLDDPDSVLELPEDENAPNRDADETAPQ